MTKCLYKKLIAEFIGTFALVFFLCGAVILSSIHPDLVPPYVVPVVLGLVIGTMVLALGHISGGHFNPAVTLGFAVVKRFSWAQLVPYWLVQCFGGIVAVGALTYALPEMGAYGMTLPAVNFKKAFMWEVVLTFFLMFVIISVATDKKAMGMLAGVAIGGVIMLDAFVGGAMTGASMNPARSLAPALFAADYKDLWIYLIAPLVGAMLATWTYEIIRTRD